MAFFPTMQFPHQTLNEVILWRLGKSESDTAFFVEDGRGGFQASSFKDCRRDVLALAAALRNRGLNVGDRVGLLSDVRQEWTNCDLSNLLARLVTVGIYPTSMPDQVEYILRHSEARMLLVDTAERLQSLSDILECCPCLETIVLIKGVPPDGIKLPVVQLAELLVTGAEILQSQGETPFVTEAQQARADDIVTLVYTSGTTGPPKGAILTH